MKTQVQRVVPGLLTVLALSGSLPFAVAQGVVGPVSRNALPPPGVYVNLQGLGGNCLAVKQTNPPSPGNYNFCSEGGAIASAYAASMTFRLNDDGTIVDSSGQCLDFPFGYLAQFELDSFAPVFFDNCSGTPGQIWEQRGQQFINILGGCLDVQGGNSATGTAVDVARCNGTPAQNWRIINTPTALQGPGTTCLDIPDGDRNPGAWLQIYECNRGPYSQTFTFSAAGEIKTAAGLCVAVDSIYVNWGGLVDTEVCGSGLWEKWTVQGREVRLGGSDWCLSTMDRNGGWYESVETATSGTSVGVASCNGTSAQQWIAADLFEHGPATLLIVTSDLFAPTFQDFIAHKQAIGVSTKLLTMSQIAKQYPASSIDFSQDDALSLKYAIEDSYRNYGARYVLLGGDTSQVPARYLAEYHGTFASPTIRDFGLSDLYYANLYSGHQPGSGYHKGFDNWDSNGNGLFNEQGWDTLDNPDNVDGFPDIAVGRIPAFDTTSLAAVLGNIIAYEKRNPVYRGTGYRWASEYGWVADACYPGYAEIATIANVVGGMQSGFAEEVGQSCVGPPNNSWSIDNPGWGQFVIAAQAGFEWITYVGHGGPDVWGGNGTWSANQVSELANPYADPSIVASVSCRTTQFAAWPLSMPVSWRPRLYDPDGQPSINYSKPNIGNVFLYSGAAVAYMGENIIMQDDAGTGFMQYLYSRRANGYARIGDMWRMAQQDYFNANFVHPAYDVHFSPPRIYLSIESFLGDPSMRTQ